MSLLSCVASPWRLSALRLSWPGASIAIVIALAASFISATYGGPKLLYALFFGLAFHFLSEEPTCRPGIEFCSKTVLRTGVALLGARITVEQIISLGMAPIAIAAGAVAVTLCFGWALSKWLRRPAIEGVLSGGAVGICGASAALAISAVMPQSRENEKFTLLVVVGVTTLSTIAMVVYPLLAGVLGLDVTDAGVFIGGTIHDVAQVVGAGYMMSSQTGDVATFVKLTRVAMLVPVVLLLGSMFKTKGKSAAGGTPALPLFLIGFVVLMLANSVGILPPGVAQWLGEASQACLVVAIAALGVKTSLKSLAELGWQPMFMLLAETVWIAVFVLTALFFID
jgi:uncharacterized integral membrane protein (TIGR00698 family)